MSELFQRIERQNINAIHKAEQAAEGINTRIAVLLTKCVGSMWTAYTFVIIALVGLLAILGVLSPLVALLVAWTSQTLIQLVLLPVIMVGQNVLNRKTELQADQQYNDIEHILSHMDAQDKMLLEIHETIVKLLEGKQ